MRKEVFVYFLVLLVLGLPVITLSMAAVKNTTTVPVSPSSIVNLTVDGDPSDWVGIPSGDNTYTVSNGEGIWRDMAFDDTGNGSYIYPNGTHTGPPIFDSAGAPWSTVDGKTVALAYTDKFGGTSVEPFWYKHGGMCDLKEFRVRGNESHLFMMFRIENMGSQAIVNEYNAPGGTHWPSDPRFPYVNATGFGKILIQVYVSKDPEATSGRKNATMYGNFNLSSPWDFVVDVAGDVTWSSQYPLGYPRVEFANGTVVHLNQTVPSSDRYQPYKATYVQANCDIYPACIEMAVPYSIIGDPALQTWRFYVVVGGFDEGRWRQVWSTEWAQMMGWPPLFRFCGGEGEDPGGFVYGMGNDPNIIDMAFTASQAKQEALLNEFQTTGQLVQIGAFQDVHFDANGDVKSSLPPPEYTQVLLVKETVGISRVFEPVDYQMMFDDGKCLDAVKQIRVLTEGGVEIPSQVYNVTKYNSGYTKSCNIVFQANVTANSEAMYHIYYGNPDATMPTYPTDLSHMATDVNITVCNTHYKASFVKKDPSWYGIPDYISYLYYNAYNPTENLGRADWSLILMTVMNIPPYWFGPFPEGKPIHGTNVTITEQGPVFIEVKAVYGDWTIAGVNSLIKTFRFYARIPWFTFSADFNLTGANYGHIQTESYLSKTAFYVATYRKTDGSLKTFGISPSQGDFLDWDGTWIDTENVNTTDNPVGISFIVMNGTDPPLTGFRSDQNAIALFQSGSLLEARQELAILLHQGNYVVTEQAHKMMTHPLIVIGFIPPIGEHDLSVSLEAPEFLMPGDSSLLNATVYNRGWSNETDVELQLLVESNLVDSVVISFLQADASYTLSYLWTSAAEGVYNATAYAVPVAGENYTKNNMATRFVVVMYPLIQPVEGQWANYTTYATYSFENDVIIVKGQQNITYDHYISPYLINITRWFKIEEDDWEFNATDWMVVNIMNRRMESYPWSPWYYDGWIETNITLGSTINLFDSTATVVGSQIIEVDEYAIDCWELCPVYEETFKFTYWYDKVSGLLVGMKFEYEYEDYSYRSNLTLIATNIPIGGLPLPSFTHSPSIPFVNETVTFDASASYDPDGTIVDYMWDFGDGTTGNGSIVNHTYTRAGVYTVTLTVTDDEGLSNTATTSVIVVTEAVVKLDVDVDVGSIHFRGEMAEFYILVSCLGEPINTGISAVLYYNGASHTDLSSSVESITTGLYRVTYTIPVDASAGTYVLVVKASILTLRGTALKSFLLSATLTGWNGWLTEIRGDIATIKTDVGAIKVSLEAVNARLDSIDGEIATIETDMGTIQTDISTIHAVLTSINGTLATIQSDIGTIQVNLGQIHATLAALNGTVATIQSDLGTIETDIGNIQLQITHIEGNTTTISTALGTIQGTIVSIRGDVVIVKTDIGEVKIDLEDIKDKLPSAQTTALGISIGSILATIAAIASITAVILLLRRRKTAGY